MVDTLDDQPQRQMPKYRCHKEVHALKIKAVLDANTELERNDGWRVIVPADEGFAAFAVSPDYVRKHRPHAGGYYVVYADGYKSFSPAKAFEEGYTRI